jgi:hypothetical protein
MKKISLILVFLLTIVSLFAQRFEVDTISKTGDLDSRINLVFLSDGYQAEELDKFIDDVNWMMDAIFSKDPYTSYRKYFNAFAIIVPSAVSGAADDPGALIDNYFGSTFNWANIWRLVVPAHSNKVQSVLRDNFPEYDQVMMLVNDSRYGGSGGWISTNTTHTDGPEICIHEMGHSFASLGDEYWAGQQYAGEKINMTQESDPNAVKWARWINYRSTGVYPHSENPDWYRPHQNCEMRYLNREFCPVCQEAISSRILDLTSPVVSYFPSENTFVAIEEEVRFRVELLEPDPNTLKLIWSLNADSVAGNVDSLLLRSEQLLTGANRVSLSILDTTKYIRKSSHSRIHLNRINWDFDFKSTGIQPFISKTKFNFGFYPNPARDEIHLDFDLPYASEVDIVLFDALGKAHRLLTGSKRIEGRHELSFDLTSMNLSAGNYYLKLLTSEDVLTLPLIIQ